MMLSPTHSESIFTSDALCSVLPPEILVMIFKHLEWYDVWKIRGVSRFFHDLVDHLSVYDEVKIGSSTYNRDSYPSNDPCLPPQHILDLVLPRTARLQIRLRDSIPLDKIFEHSFIRLTHLDLDCTSFDGKAIRSPIETVISLRARWCRMLRDARPLASYFPSLKSLDLSWSPIQYLPSSDAHNPSYYCPWPSLVDLTLVGTLLNVDSLGNFFKSIPHSIQTIDCHILPPYPYRSALIALARSNPPNLQFLDIRGWDCLTLVDLREAIDLIAGKLPSSHYYAIPFENITFTTIHNHPLSIFHDIMLESDDERGYRHFIRLLS